MIPREHLKRIAYCAEGVDVHHGEHGVLRPGPSPIVGTTPRAKSGERRKPRSGHPCFQDSSRARRQNRPKPFRCQPITVAALTMETRDSPPVQTEENHAQRKRSAGLNFGRLAERWSTP